MNYPTDWIRHRGSKSMPKRLEGMRFEVKMRDREVREYTSDTYDIRAIYQWNHAGICTDIMAYRIIGPIEDEWPEDRIDAIGQNGNDGLHYEEIDVETRHVTPAGVSVLDDLGIVDMVNEPPHYKQGDIECIDAIRAALTDEEWRGYCKGNALKYIWRERHKGSDESLQKAVWYLNKLLEK